MLTARIDWLNRDGTSTPLRPTPARWLHPRFSPDGHRLAFDLFDGTQYDVWTYDWSRDALSRLTFDPGADVDPGLDAGRSPDRLQLRASRSAAESVLAAR